MTQLLSSASSLTFIDIINASDLHLQYPKGMAFFKTTIFFGLGLTYYGKGIRWSQARSTYTILRQFATKSEYGMILVITAADFYKLILENSEKILMEIAIQTHCNVGERGGP